MRPGFDAQRVARARRRAGRQRRDAAARAAGQHAQAGAAQRTTAPAAASTRSSSTPATTRCWAPRSAHGLHGTPWRPGAGRALSSAPRPSCCSPRLEPSVLCPVSMTYAVTPALRANAGVARRLGRQAWPATDYDPRFVPFDAEDGADDGHGHDREAGRLRRARQHHARRARRRRRLGPALPASPATSGSSRRRCATPSWCWRRRAGAA